ncbi:Ig-like domain-containing protein [Flavobacterium caseinilyticum]|uniref:T9SS type A sorting domain-containing protein n=1 Tax=Flavobacterium caseinilyticum TaxID=2541732 RepID=A0A4R5ALT0_9FLAO|nr:T9SS type A sorting domain-containing protein [Flavobacterium caseinilyticum]TDD73691.1 T9SS type A sorting domain-containing protein [Flavobacterium caseinilyticum]
MKKSTIFEILDVLYCKITQCIITENNFSKLDAAKSSERNSINYLVNAATHCWLQKFVIPILLVGFLMASYTTNAQNILGRAPVLWPKGGFAVDGNEFVKYPGDNPLWGDFLFEAGETNVGADPGGIFVPVPPPYTYPDGPLPASFYVYPYTTFFRDNITNNDPTIFTSSNKINDPVSSFTWGAGSSPNKNEIQNAIAHFSYGDPALGGVATDLWMIFAADRQVTEGSSYIDFEILQKKLTMEMNGTFSSEAGTLSGRTIGDLLVTIEFTQGGDFANVVTRRWDGTSYIEFTPAVGTVFGTNNTGQTIVPYPIYNQDPISTNPDLWAYEPNQWAEGAVNVTSFFGNDPCFVISTLFVRTRTSGSSGQSELKDFPGAPFQLDLSFVPDAPTVTSVTRCDPGIVALSASGCPGGTLTWYDAAINGNIVATGSSYSPNITQTTSYWVSCTNSRGCEGPRTQVTGTVNVISPGTIDGSQTLCTPFDPVAFTSTTPATGTGTLTYQWQISTTGCTGTWTDIANATLATYDAPAVTVITNFRRVATSTLNGVACPAISNCLTVTPNNVTSGSIAGDQTLCTPFDPIAFTSTTAGTGSGPVTYQWQISTTGCTGTWTNIANATAAIYDAPTVAVTTYFRRVTTSTLNGVLCSANSNCLIVTPNPVAPGVIAGDQTGCAPFDPVAFTSSSAGTGGGVITYQWQISTTGCNGTWSNIANATAATYDAPSVSALTNFRRVTTSTVNGIACSANSNCLTITPSGVNAGEIAGSQTLCSPFDPAPFTSTTAGTGTGVITYQWQSNTTGCNGTWTNIANATAATYDAPAVAVVTYFRRVTTSTLNGVPCIANSNCLTVSPNNVSAGVIAGNQTLCSPFDPAAFTSTTAGTGSGTITYQWQISTTACSGPWTNIAMATSATYDAPVVLVVTYFRRVTTSTLNGVLCSANSNCLTVTPESINPGTIAGSQTLCTPFDPVAFTSTTPATNGGVISYQWQMSTTSCSAGFTDIVGANSATYDAATVSVVTYFRRVATSTLNGTACPDFSNCLTVTPNNVSAGSIAGDQEVCIGDDVAAFTSTTPGSGSAAVTYQWQSNTTGCGGTFTNIEGATLATYDPGVASVTTYYRRVATSTLNGVPCSANSNCLTVIAESCADALCTYTQGYYGNLGGMSCAPDNGGFTKYTTLALIDRALTYYGGTMTIGSLGNTVVITNTPIDRMAIIDVLPGGGKSYVLSGSYSISALPSSYLKNGRINNTLLAQTIVLGLNIGINGALGDFALQGGTLVTAESQGGCGSDIAKTRICNADGTVTNDYEYYPISPNVVAAITGDKTVQGLFDLANRALGGGAINGLSLSEIASAVDMINNAFDGCRIFVGYDIPRCNETTIGIPTIDAKVESAGFDAYPVPFTDQLTIKYKFDYVTDVKIEVFNAQGIMILSKTDANGYLNKELALNLSANVGKEQVYVVKVTTNRGSTVKKVMSAK